MLSQLGRYYDERLVGGFFEHGKWALGNNVGRNSSFRRVGTHEEKYINMPFIGASSKRQ